MTTTDRRSSRTMAADPAARLVLQRMLNEDAGTSLISEYSKSSEKALPPNLRAQFTLSRLQKPTVPVKASKLSGRGTVFIEQMKKLEEKQKLDLVIMDDLQEFVKARAKLELDHANNLAKLAQQYQQKRKLPSPQFKDGHANILTADLYRCVLDSSIQQSKSRAVMAQRLFRITGENFDSHREECKGLQKNAMRMLSNLQQELFKLDVSVQNAKKQYDSAMKETNKAGKKSKKKGSQQFKKGDSKAQFARHEYLLELAAANQHYLKFRNEQVPEVTDIVAQRTIDFLHNFFDLYTEAITTSCGGDLKIKDLLRDLSRKLSAEFERRSFIHENRHEFPGRQLFDMEPYHDAESRDIQVDQNSKHVLMQLRKLLMHHVSTIETELGNKEEQLEGLQNLRLHYQKAGDVFDKGQASSMQSKMEALYRDIEELAVSKSHLDSKIAKITSSGIDNFVLARPSSVMDVAEAQAREADRRLSTLPRGSHASDMSLPVRIVGTPAEALNGAAPPTAPATPARARTSIPQEDPSIQQARDRANAAADQLVSAMGTEANQTANSTTAGSPRASATSGVAEAALRLSIRLGRGTPDGVLSDPESPGPTAAVPQLPPPQEEDEDAGPAPPPLPPPPSESLVEELGVDYPPLPPPPPPGLDETDDQLRAASPTAGRKSSCMTDFSDENEDEEEVPLKYKALYAYDAAQADDLGLAADEIIYVLVVRDDGWCLGMNGKGSMGYFPQSYVQMLDDQDANDGYQRPRVVHLSSQQHGLTLGAKEPVRIMQVASGCAAQNSGVRAGDLILEVNSEPCADMDLDGVQGLIAQAADAKFCILTLPA